MAPQIIASDVSSGGRLWSSLGRRVAGFRRAEGRPTPHLLGTAPESRAASPQTRSAMAAGPGGAPPGAALQQGSQRLSLGSVYAVLEEASRVPGRDRVERPAHRFDKDLPAPGFCFAQDALDLREGPLYGAQVGGIGRQVKQFAAPLFDELPDAIPLWVLRLSITTTCPGRGVGRALLDVGLEHRDRGRCLYRKSRAPPLPRSCWLTK